MELVCEYHGSAVGILLFMPNDFTITSGDSSTVREKKHNGVVLHYYGYREPLPDFKMNAAIKSMRRSVM